MKNETDTNSGEKRFDKNLKNYIKLIMMERPNTSDDTKLLTITMRKSTKKYCSIYV